MRAFLADTRHLQKMTIDSLFLRPGTLTGPLVITLFASGCSPLVFRAGLKTTFGLVSTKGVYPISPKYLDTVAPMAKDVNGLVEAMYLLQEDFDTLYAKAQAAKPSARQIRIGLLRVAGTDPAIDPPAWNQHLA
jgi:hypothetical protein